MIEIGDKLVSTELFEEEFVCNLSACKGACCVDGDDGAPLTMDEVNLLEDHIDLIKPYLNEKGLAEIEKNGVFYMDRDNDPVTMLNGGKECSFVTKGEDGIYKCGIEQAYRDGAIHFNKPISCHLYPIRVKEYRSFSSLNYDRWPICSDACKLGKELKVSVYKFLKEPIIRAFGEDFYNELEQVDKELKQTKLND
ncbi:DUF3109 family protein [Paracrocinitomix mangrovi]|uniref:DUF3109 family protein n=1 Tax=Paracrocinitomix mangrovi TaxID=2862509 RepID=UPI001C8EDB68|nr:DUF3109 family protein [Paracrocinitomix mangrovi]UKN03861.1 DUF3109 family protein [Paracrocinitomix mangrovi]